MHGTFFFVEGDNLVECRNDLGLIGWILVSVMIFDDDRPFRSLLCNNIRGLKQPVTGCTLSGDCRERTLGCLPALYSKRGKKKRKHFETDCAYSKIERRGAAAA